MKQPARILVADDSRDDVFLLRQAFSEAGLAASIDHMLDGEQAIQYLLKADPAPDLILLDLKMPRMDGFGVLEWLRTQPRLGHLPAVVLSASIIQEDKNKAKALGAHAFFTKPADFEDFIGLATNIYHQWLPPSQPERTILQKQF